MHPVAVAAATLDVAAADANRTWLVPSAGRPDFPAVIITSCVTAWASIARNELLSSVWCKYYVGWIDAQASHSYHLQPQLVRDHSKEDRR